VKEYIVKPNIYKLMKFVITENQFKSLVMEVDEKDLQKASNYVTRAVRTKFPVVDEIEILPIRYRNNPEYDGSSLKITIYVTDQLDREYIGSNILSERMIVNYVTNILKKFFGFNKIRKVSFDSTNFEYIGGNWNT